MARPFISIVGLGQTGASLGLALRRDEADFDVVGHDKEPMHSNRAKKAGAVDRTDWNLHNAVEGADLVVLAIPVGEVDDTLRHISEDLRPGNLVLACVKTMQPAIDAAGRHLPDGVHFVAAHPILTEPDSEAMRANLFEDAVFCLAPGAQTDPDAIGLASDLVDRVGANPLYMDPQEHDGIVAGVEVLPTLLAAALMRQASKSSGWAESQRLAGRRFAGVTDLGGNARQIKADLLANRAALTTRLDQLIGELSLWRQLIADAQSKAPEDGESAEDDQLLAALDEAIDARIAWEADVKLKRWNDATIAPEEVESAGVLRQLFFGNLLRGRRPRDDGQPEDESR